MSDLEEQVRAVILEHLDIADKQFDRQASFNKQLGMDSLDAMDLLLAIDETFKVRIPVTTMEQIDNLQQLVDAIKALLSP